MATAKKINACVGIEIVGKQMNCSVLTKNSGYVFTTILPDDIVDDYGALVYDKETSKVFKDILKSNSVKIRDFSLILPSNASISKNVELAVMPTAALLKALTIEVQQNGGGPGYVFDYSVIGLKHNFQKEVTGMHLHYVSADSEDLLDQKDIFKWAGVNLHTATDKITALTNVIRYYKNLGDDLNNNESLCFLEITYTSLTLYFFEGLINVEKFNRTLDYGVKNIEQAIARAGIKEEEVGMYISNQANGVDYNTFETVETQISLMTEEVLNTVRTFNTRDYNNNLSEIICIGEGTKLFGLLNKISEAVKVPLDTATNKLSNQMQITGENFDQCIPAIGCALQL